LKQEQVAKQNTFHHCKENILSPMIQLTPLICIFCIKLKLHLVCENLENHWHSRSVNTTMEIVECNH